MATTRPPSGASSPRSQPASSSLTHDDDAAETQANAAAIRAARHAEARRRALERASARAKASRGLKASLQAETAAPSPPPAPRIDENDRERWWEDDGDAENQAGSKDDDDDDDATELAASFEKSVAVKTVTAASSGRREMPTRRPRLALPPPSLPTGKPPNQPAPDRRIHPRQAQGQSRGESQRIQHARGGAQDARDGHVLVSLFLFPYGQLV